MLVQEKFVYIKSLCVMLGYFQSCYVLVYILFVFLFSLPSQTSSWINHLSFQMAFAAIWNLNFELGSTGKWKVSQYMQLGKITLE